MCNCPEATVTTATYTVVTVASGQLSVLAPALQNNCNIRPSDFVNGHVSTMWFMA